MLEAKHLHAHEGEAYDGGWLFSGVADGAQARMLLIPLNTDEPAHLDVAAVAGGRAVLHLYEAPTIVASGTFVGGVNYNRLLASAQPAEWLTYYTPTISDVGDRLHTSLVPGSAAANPVGSRSPGAATAGFEWICNTGTAYLVVVQNQSGATVPVEIELEWYEEGLN
jgi:hypothetical protein